MKTSQTIKIWKKFLKEQRELEEEVLEEEEPFQKAVKKGYLKKRDQYTTTGPQKTGGAPFDKNPKRSRAEGSPPAGVSVAEENSLEEVSIDFLKKIPGIIGRAFAGEEESDQETGNEPVQSGEQVSQVNIELPVPEEKKADIINDTEVRKLLSAFFAKWDINDPDARNEFSRALKLSPNAMIKKYTYLAGVDNVATQEDEKTKEIKPDNPDNPTADSSPRSNPNKIEKLLQILKDRSADEEIGELIDRHVTNWARKEYSGSPTGAKDFMQNMKTSIEQIKNQLEDALSKPLKESNKSLLLTSAVLLLETMCDSLLKESLSINNVSGVELTELTQNINKFYPYAQEYLKFDRPVSLNLVSDPDNAKDTFGKTAYYNPNNDEITIFVDKRHPKDMIRSFSHELVHHAQNCRGEFDKDFVAGENYIEENDHLNLMEREAYVKGNMCLRYYESYLKKENKKMSLNEETLRKAIREAIKRVTENKTETVNEEEVVTETTEEVTEEIVTEEEETIDEVSCKNHTRDDEKHMKEEETVTEEEEVTEATETVTEEETVNEEEVEEGMHSKKDEMKEEAPTSIRESLNKEKGKLIFDRLVDKWCK